MGLCTEMFFTFSKIGTFTLGGGFAMVPLMEKEVVDRKGWLGKEEFLNIIVVSQSVPGIFAVNMASHIGYKLRGLKGGFVGAFGVALPSIIIILLIAMFFREFKSNIYVEKFFMGIRPAVVALIAAPVFSMAKSAKISKRNIWIPVLSALLISAWGISPVFIILVAGLGGFIYGRMRKDSEEK